MIATSSRPTEERDQDGIAELRDALNVVLPSQRTAL